VHDGSQCSRGRREDRYPRDHQTLELCSRATLVASLAGSKDPKISYKWARADGPEPKNDAVRSLQFAHTQWLAITASGDEHVARM
jgi:hypothetical protein